jgi:pimeloyl-ACP methyl ester carboxylesterase
MGIRCGSGTSGWSPSLPSHVRRFLKVFAFLAAAAALAYFIRNPERRSLDAAERTAAPGAFVRLFDGVTHYEVAGPDTGQRVVLVHGFSVPSYIWDSTFNALTASGFRVMRYDVFGRGWSDRPRRDYTLEFTDLQLTELLDSLMWTGPVDLIGLSYGGAIVGAFGGRHPERVRSITMVDPVATTGAPLPAVIRAPLLGSYLWQVLQVPKMADGQASDFVDPSKWPDWADKYRVQQRYRGFGRALRSTQLERPNVLIDTLYQRIGALKTRSLLIWGTEDRTVPIAHAVTVRAAIPQMEFHAIPGVGHLPHIEAASTVNPILVAFLRAGRPAPAPPTRRSGRRP